MTLFYFKVYRVHQKAIEKPCPYEKGGKKSFRPILYSFYYFGNLCGLAVGTAIALMAGDS